MAVPMHWAVLKHKGCAYDQEPYYLYSSKRASNSTTSLNLNSFCSLTTEAASSSFQVEHFCTFYLELLTRYICLRKSKNFLSRPMRILRVQTNEKSLVSLCELIHFPPYFK